MSSTKSSDEVLETAPPTLPDSPPPALPDTSPPSDPWAPSSSRRNSSPLLTPPEKPPRTFSDSSETHTPRTLTPYSSSPPSPDSFRTPPESLHILSDSFPTPPADASEKPISDARKMTANDVTSESTPTSETGKKIPNGVPTSLSMMPPSDAGKNVANDVTSAPDVAGAGADEKGANNDVGGVDDVQPTSVASTSGVVKVVDDVTKEDRPLVVPTVCVVAPGGGGDAAADDVFAEVEDQRTGLLRRPSLRRKTPSGAGSSSSLKRVVSARIDRIGSAISRFLDRDKAPSYEDDYERPKSMGSSETSFIRRTDVKKNDNGDNKDSIIPYGSNFLRRSFRQKSYEPEDDEERPPSPGSEASGRGSVYHEQLVASLVCAACARYMVGPIEQCKRGHNICNLCRRRAHQHRCPVCSARLSGIRNRVAEDMARKLLFPCVHAHAGCTRQVPSDELEFHEPRCPFRVYGCLISVQSGVPCKWEGRRVELEEHVRAIHPRYYSPQETTKWRWSPNLLVKMEDFQLISAFGEIFWYCAAQDPDRLRVCWFVQHIGYDQDSVKYEFRIEFAADEKDRRLEFACTTLPDYSAVSSIIESGCCLDMSYQQALSFVDEEGTIKFSVTIYKLD